jgi:hypothetical protein
LADFLEVLHARAGTQVQLRDHHVRLVEGDELQRLIPFPGVANHDKLTLSREQGVQALAEELMIIDHENAANAAWSVARRNRVWRKDETHYYYLLLLLIIIMMQL